MIVLLLAVPLLVAGAAFALIGSLGLLRMPDFYTRMHASSKLDTLALALFMGGLAILNGPDLNAVKLLLIVLFAAVANPAAAHALGRAAVRSGLPPWVRGSAARTDDTAP